MRKKFSIADRVAGVVVAGIHCWSFLQGMHAMNSCDLRRSLLYDLGGHQYGSVLSIVVASGFRTL